MTNPAHEIPEKAQTGASVAPFYQTADPAVLGRQSNLDLHARLEEVRDSVLNGLLDGFNSAGEAVQAGVEAIILALTGQIGSLEDLQEWAETRDIGFFFELVSGVTDANPNDAASWIRGRIAGAETLIRDARNAVWAGVTRQDPEEDKSAEQVEAALSALRSRAQETALENELMQLGSVPVHEGPSSAGDVTCDIDNIDWYQPLDVAGQTSNSVVAFTDHYHGDGTLSVPAPQPPTITGTATASTDLIATFRARSTLPKEIITFSPAGIATQLDGAWVYLLTYDFALDKWVIVSVGESSYHTSLGTEFSWVDMPLTPAYTPAIGELMAVGWRVKPKPTFPGAAVKFAASRKTSAPAYHSVPYGKNTIFQTAPNEPVMGAQMSLPLFQGGAVAWRWGETVYAQIGPDLGQTLAEPEKLDFYDDFNRSDLGSAYAKFTSSGVTPGLSGNRLAFRDTNNGMQAILRRQQLNTNRTRVEATLYGAGSTASADLIINSNSSLTNFLTIGVTANNLYLYTGVGIGDGTQRIAIPTTGNNVRWAVEYHPDTKVYWIYKNGVFFTSWSDPTGIVRTGPGERFCGAATARQTFFNSGQWDDLLMYDV